MTSRIAGWALLAVFAAGCSSKGSETTTAAPSGTAQATPAPDAAAQPNAVGQPNSVVQASPGAIAQAPSPAPAAPGDAAQAPMQSATANAAAEAKLNDPVSTDELKEACKLTCQRAVACKPANAPMTEQGCVDSCSTAPKGAAKRYAIEGMKRCHGKTDCGEFNSCMAGGAPAAPPPGAGPAPVAPQSTPAR
ncbi:MAG: hypothetical protein FJ096_02920 [Deltaproteobacteria bacterium]|nr:hypothetical protein [Deltaproteobacteria bacterium]